MVKETYLDGQPVINLMKFSHTNVQASLTTATSVFDKLQISLDCFIALPGASERFVFKRKSRAVAMDARYLNFENETGILLVEKVSVIQFRILLNLFSYFLFVNLSINT